MVGESLMDESGDAIDLRQWRQGDFTRSSGPFIFGDVPTGQSEDEQIGAVADDSCGGFVVVSQTCEIVSDPAKFPLIVVCPLVKLERQHREMVDRGQSPAFAIIDNAPDCYVAEIRKMMSVTKRLVASWERNSGFCDPRRAINFAHALERNHGRFAFPDAFNVSISSLKKKVFEKYRRPESPLGKTLRVIDEIRVRPSGSWDDSDVKLTFLFFLSAERIRHLPMDQVSGELESLIGSIEWRSPFRLDPIVPIKVGGYADLTALDIHDSVELDINALSYAARFASMSS